MKNKDVNVDNTAGAAELPKKRVIGRPFPKGVSGNPKGKPPGAFSLVSLIKKELQKKAIIEGKKVDKTYADLFVKRVMKNTIEEGDNALIKEVIAHVDGAPARKIDVTSGGEPISGFNYIVPEEGGEN